MHPPTYFEGRLEIGQLEIGVPGYRYTQSHPLELRVAALLTRKKVQANPHSALIAITDIFTQSFLTPSHPTLLLSGFSQYHRSGRLSMNYID